MKRKYNWLTKRPKYIQIFYSLLSLTIVVLFAFWWFRISHIPSNFSGNHRIYDVLLFILVSYVIWQPIIMEMLTWAISLNIKDIPFKKPVPGMKVAFITTIVPKNESLSLLHRCLPAMVRANYKHDTWLLDEGNSAEVKKICRKYKVFHFSRLGFENYSSGNGKFTRTKGGNHNSWYDYYGNNYDIVAQIDTDFVPKKNFLEKTLGYFRDPKVAFVGTPQIYGNKKDSIVVQGADEQQYSFYGCVLRGLSGLGMNFLIGANHIIRVSALNRVGHYKAHITEDLPTGMKLHARGYKSVYLPYSLAIGEGPFSWEAYFNQQMRWAYGCMDILFHYTPRYFLRLGLKKAFFYFLLQQHYFTGVAMALSVLLLSIYFAFGLRAADVDYVRFIILYSLITLVCWLMSVWLQRYNVYRKNEGELLFAGKWISIAAWPVWFLAFLSVVRRKPLKYIVTPKGGSEKLPLVSFRPFIPHLALGTIALLGAFSSFFTQRNSPIMLYWAISCTLLMYSMPFSQLIVVAYRKARKTVIKSYKNIYNKALLIWNKIASGNNKSKNFEMNFESIRKMGKIEVKGFITDCIFLSSVFIFSIAQYITKIGFYSDDWSFLGNFILSKDQSILGLIRTATTPNTFMRPMQNIYDALLFWFFRTEPLGYQIVNACVLLGVVLLLYYILRKISLPRIIALTVALVYSLLPNYSTDRFWFASFQANLSMLLILVSLYMGLKALSNRTINKTGWKAMSIISLILSALSYEVALPLVLVNILLFWSPWKKLKDKYNKIQNHGVFILLNLIAVGYILFFKVVTTTRLGNVHFPADVFRIIHLVFSVNYYTLGIKLPIIWGEILSKYSNPVILVQGLILYVAIFLYLFFVITKSGINFPKASWSLKFTFFSFILTFLGYSIFLTNNLYGFSSTGIDNRVAISAAVGIAFTFVGLGGFVSKLMPSEKLSRWFYCVFISIVSTGGFLIISTLSTFWVGAYQKSRLVLDDIHNNLPSINKNTTLLLDGVCPYNGPGIVFESQWDLKGALQAVYKDPTIKADVVTPRLKVQKNGMKTQIYTYPNMYTYKNMIIYNARTKEVHKISDVNAAKAYFAENNPHLDNGCPDGHPGNGVSVFLENSSNIGTFSKNLFSVRWELFKQ